MPENEIFLTRYTSSINNSKSLLNDRIRVVGISSEEPEVLCVKLIKANGKNKDCYWLYYLKPGAKAKERLAKLTR